MRKALPRLRLYGFVRFLRIAKTHTHIYRNALPTLWSAERFIVSV